MLGWGSVVPEPTRITSTSEYKRHTQGGGIELRRAPLRTRRGALLPAPEAAPRLCAAALPRLWRDGDPLSPVGRRLFWTGASNTERTPLVKKKLNPDVEV